MKRMNYIAIGCVLAIIALFGTGTKLSAAEAVRETAAENNPCSELEGETVRWIIPYPPGGGYDVYSRMIAPRLEDKLGVEVRIDYVTGAAGLVAAKTLMASKPDGLTLGLLNGSGFVMAFLYGETSTPHPLKDLTLLGRLNQNKPILVTNANSPFKTIDDLVKIGRTRPILFASGGLGSSDFISTAMLHKIFNIQYRIITGYKGGKELIMAVIHGEVDAVVKNVDAAKKMVESGELNPLLRFSAKPYPMVGWYDELPVLEGPDGVAARLAEKYDEDIAQARLDAEALTFFGSTSRIVCGPPNMKKSLARCLEKTLMETFHDPAFVDQAEKADRSLDPAGSSEVSAAFTFLEQTGAKYADFLNREIKALK